MQLVQFITIDDISKKVLFMICINVQQKCIKCVRELLMNV